MLRLRFAKLNAAGNITVLVLDPLTRDVYSEAARKIMSSRGLGAEQVGFIEPSGGSPAVARLHMMGGEFCGNAARSLAAWLVFIDHLNIMRPGGEVRVPIEVSGYSGILVPRVLFAKAESTIACVASPMPVPRKVSFFPFEGQMAALVEFEGISHAVLWGVRPSTDVFFRLLSALSDPEADAFGVMFFSEEDSHVTPLVAVRKSGSLEWEGSCASGTVAVGSAMAARDGHSINKLSLAQPGGTLQVDVVWKGEVLEATIGGQVEIIAHGETWVNAERGSNHDRR